MSHMFEEFVKNIQDNTKLSDGDKIKVLQNLGDLKAEKVHVLITGATGCGKSSTINALFDREMAKVGQSSNPETMSIERYDFNNVVLFDSPGLGDGIDADFKHAKNIINKLIETKSNGDLLIDLVLVILDGSSRDLGTSYQLINEVIIPNLGEDKSRLLIAINQADVAMKGRYWNHEKNEPESQLIQFLDEKVESTKARIYEATKVKVEPIYYAAGYKDGDEQQYPWNLIKLLAYILRHTKEEKRIIFQDKINKDPRMYAKGKDLIKHQEEVETSFTNSWILNVGKGLVEGAVNIVRDVVGSTVRAVGGFISKAASWIGSLF